MSDKICLLPWIHIEADPNGAARPCCMWQGADVGNFNTQTIDQVWEGEPMQQLRAEFLSGGQPAGCERCWRAESAGYNSKRLNDNARFAHHSHRPGAALAKPVYLDLKLGNICNIKCRICSSDYSYKWREDEQALYGQARNTRDIIWVSEDADFWNSLSRNLSDLEFIDLTGGEPFLVKPMWRLLEQCVAQGVAHNISLHYNTNGTVLPTPEQRELWSHFKWVETMFSIDGVGAKFEYQRNPARWHTVLDNLKTIQQEGVTHTSICYTVNTFNVLDIPEFDVWSRTTLAIKPYWNLLHGPAHYSIINLPTSAKQTVAAKIENYTDIVKYMNSSTQDARSWQQFLWHTQQLDSVRKESFSDTFPELHRIILE